MDPRRRIRAEGSAPISLTAPLSAAGQRAFFSPSFLFPENGEIHPFMYGSNQNGEIRPFMHGSNQKVAENTPLCTDFTIQSIHKGVLLTKKILATISEEAAAPERPAIPSASSTPSTPSTPRNPLAPSVLAVLLVSPLDPTRLC